MLRKLSTILAVLTLLLVLPATTWALSVYVLSGSDAIDDTKVVRILTLKGHTAVLGPQVWDWDGTQADLSTYDVVVMLNNYNWDTPGDMPQAGQDELVSFVQNGGGLVTGQWVDYNVSQGSFATLAPLLPGIYSNYNYYSQGKYVQVTASAVLNKNLPLSFTFPLKSVGGSEVFLAKKMGATNFYRSGNTKKPGVLGWRRGLGRVLSFSTLLTEKELNNTQFKQLFLNAVRWTSQ